MMKASILIMGHPHPEEVQFGADFSVTYDAANPYAVVVVSGALPHALDTLKNIRKNQADTQTILVSADADPNDLQTLINEAGIFKTIPHFDEQELQLAVREALEEHELIKQNQAFLNLRTEQNKKLKSLSTTLEERVQARENYLNESREVLINSTRRLEALNRALVAVQKSVSKEEMEKLVNDALKTALNLTWTQILFKNQSFLEKHGAKGHSSDLSIFSSPLFKDKELLGHIYFARDKSRPFTSDEDDFLLQVGDAVGLTIDRLMALQLIEELKQEWDSTFDAITDAVSVITPDYKLVRVNKSFADKADSNVEKVVGELCYKALFNRSSPCEECVLGETFSLGTYLVNSQKIKLEDSQNAFAVFYRDTSEQEKIQRQILESSKMAEIGTIGSSIAHEINNPLGGILAFVQIVKSETKKEDKHYQDILDMEEAALRSKSIVENLLAFTRVSGEASDFKEARLGDLIRIVVNIIELQTRGLGITLEKKIENPDLKIRANANQLVQVLVNILQNACETIAEKLSQNARSEPPVITLSVKPENEFAVFEITDNGLGIPYQLLSKVFTPFYTTKDKSKNPGLGLSVSYQIVKEHLGKMEISSVYGQSTTVVIKIPMV